MVERTVSERGPAPGNRSLRLPRAGLVLCGLLLTAMVWALPGWLAGPLDTVRGNAIDPAKLLLLQWACGVLGAVLLTTAAFLDRVTDRIEWLLSSLEARNAGIERGQATASRAVRIGIALFVVLVIGLTVHLLVDRDTALIWADEDGPIENGTAAFYVIACWMTVRLMSSARSLPRTSRLALLGLGALFLLVALEEISWGQRIFGFSTPEAVGSLNVQDEFNLHNLWSTSINNALGLLVAFGILVGGPFLYGRSARFRRLADLLGLPVAPRWAPTLALVALAAYCVIGTDLGTLGIGPRSLYGLRPHFDDEYLEFFISGMFFLAAWSGWRLRDCASVASKTETVARPPEPSGTLATGIRTG